MKASPVYHNKLTSENNYKIQVCETLKTLLKALSSVALLKQLLQQKLAMPIMLCFPSFLKYPMALYSSGSSLMELLEITWTHP